MKEMKGLKMGIKIYLDDIREAPLGWVVVRNSFDFKKLVLKTPEDIDKISFDNDLGERIEGWELANWLRDEIKAGTVKRPRSMSAHSWNPVARDKINATIREIYALKVD